MSSYKHITNIPYKYVFGSMFDYSNEPMYNTFVQNKNDVYKELIDYSNKDKVTELFNEINSIIEKIDTIGLDKISLIEFVVDRLVNRFNIDTESNKNENDTVTFYEWLATLQSILKTPISDNISIIQAIELEKIALKQIKNDV